MTAPVRPVPLDEPPERPLPVVLALGSNLGDRLATLAGAVDDLQAVPGLVVRGVSGVVETHPVGGPPQPDYLNAVVQGLTTLSARALLRACQGVEARHGRVRAQRWGPRTLDVDVIRYGDLVAADTDLAVPHPRAHQRAFVLAPWADLDPAASVPGPDGGPVVALLARADDRSGVHRRPDLRLAGATDGGHGAPS